MPTFIQFKLRLFIMFLYEIFHQLNDELLEIGYTAISKILIISELVKLFVYLADC